jgi:hypothetical protein
VNENHKTAPILVQILQVIASPIPRKQFLGDQWRTIPTIFNSAAHNVVIAFALCYHIEGF